MCLAVLVAADVALAQDGRYALEQAGSESEQYFEYLSDLNDCRYLGDAEARLECFEVTLGETALFGAVYTAADKERWSLRDEDLEFLTSLETLYYPNEVRPLAAAYLESTGETRLRVRRLFEDKRAPRVEDVWATLAPQARKVEGK